MIKDYAVRHFIFKSYIKYVEKDLGEVSALIYSNLQNTLLVKEEVLVNNKEGLIVRFSKEKYYILLKKDYAIVKCRFEEVVGKQRLDRNEIFDTLQFITYETPLGVRLLKKNIYGYVTDKSSIKDYLTFLKRTPGSTFLDKCAELEDSTKFDKSEEKGNFINNSSSSFNPEQIQPSKYTGYRVK